MAERPSHRAAPAEVGFGGLLRAYREHGLLSQERLAERSGLSTRTIRNFERGRVRRPRGESVRLLADALGLAGPQRERFEDAARGPLSANSPGVQPAPSSPVEVVPHQLPPDIADFVGRGELVRHLRELLAHRPGGMAGRDAVPVVVCAVAGKGGVGKSALAVHVAHRLVSEFPDGQLYASLRGAGAGARGSAADAPAWPLDPGEILGRFLRALGVDGGAVPDAVEERAALYRSRLADRRVLVVLDDAASEAQLRPLLPGNPGSAVLITSRARLAALEGIRLVHLDVLDTGQAVELLARIAGPQRVAADPAAATAIAVACGRLPLAVRIAGARLAARPHWPLTRMADLLSDERSRLHVLVHGDLEVRASLSLSYQGLGEEHRRLFRRLGLIDAPDVAAWVAGALLDVPLARAEGLVEDLIDGQLLDLARWDATGQPRYRLHDLLHAYALERVHAEEPLQHQQAALARALGGWLGLAEQADQRLPVGSLIGRRSAASGWQLDPRVADDLVADPLAWFEAERAALVSAIHQASTPAPAGTTGPAVELAWRLTGSMAGFFQLRSYRDDYRRGCDLALTATRREGDRRGEAWMLGALAELSADQDRLDEAVALADQARLIHQEVGDRRGEAYAWFVAGDTHRISGRFDDAVGELDHAWRLYSEVGDDQGLTWVSYCLGRIHRFQGRLTEAANDLGRALRASRSGGDRRVEALVLQGFGLLHQSLGRPDTAVSHLLKGLRICRELGDGLGEGFVLRTLGDVRLQQGAYQEAASVFGQALQVLRRVGSRRGEAAVLQGLGELQHAQARPHQARASLDAALVINRELKAMPSLARTLIALADVQVATGDHAAARRSRHEAHELFHVLGLPAGDTSQPTTTGPP